MYRKNNFSFLNQLPVLKTLNAHIFTLYVVELYVLKRDLSTVFLKSDRISVAETYFINPKIVDVSAIYYAKNDIIIEGLWRISQWL